MNTFNAIHIERRLLTSKVSGIQTHETKYETTKATQKLLQNKSTTEKATDLESFEILQYLVNIHFWSFKRKQLVTKYLHLPQDLLRFLGGDQTVIIPGILLCRFLDASAA